LHEAPDANNNPALMGVTTKPYLQVVAKASLADEITPWSGDYWATYKGGIAFRWQYRNVGTSVHSYLYDLYSPEQARALSQRELDFLSPAEKYDILTGKYNFPLASNELYQSRASVDAGLNDVPHWYGICHGWVVAATKEKQPGNIARISTADGRTLRFFSADIKALLSKYYAATQVATQFVGGRCNSRIIARDAFGRVVSPECRDLNPATFHLVLEHFIAHKQQSLNIDIDGGEEVWTQPASGYEFSYFNLRPLPADYRVPAAGTARVVDVSFNLLYTNETSPTRHPSPPAINRLTYEYTLELDRNDFIIGGEWRSDKRPDFMWQLVDAPQSRFQAGLDYHLLKQLVNLSLQ
jgi:hypothetical protein